MRAKYKSPRKAIPVRIEKAVLAKSRRRCTLCFGLHGDETEKRGQIAHLDGNRGNNAESNLAWMCLDHHSQFDSTTKQHKNYTISEVKEYRRQLYKVLRSAPQRSSRRARRSSASKSRLDRSVKVTNSPVASGANISQTINSPTVNLSLAAPTSGTPGRERYDEWRELIDETHASIEQMWWAFVDAVEYKAGDERCDYQAGIRRGNRVFGNRILIADAIQKSGLKEDWNQLVQYTHSGRGPRDRWQHGSATMGGFDQKAREFQEKLMRIAREDMSPPTQAALQVASKPLINHQEGIAEDFDVHVVHGVSRMIDRESGEERFEEHRHVIAERPKLFLEYSNSIAAQYAMTFSGLSLRNDGGRAFNIEFEPDVLAGLTLLMENPARSLDKGGEYHINLRTCKNKDGIRYPIGGMLSEQIRTLFERLADVGADDEFKIQIKCIDFDKRVFTSQSILRWDLLTKRIWCERGD